MGGRGTPPSQRRRTSLKQAKQLAALGPCTPTPRSPQSDEDVDLERYGNRMSVAWTAPGEWITYTVENDGREVQDVAVQYAVVGVLNGLALALDLDDPSECGLLRAADDKVKRVQ